MKKENKSQLFEAELKKLMYRINYKISESPRYRPLVGIDEEFDDLPMKNEAGDQEDAPKPDGGQVPPAPSNDQPIGMETPVPDFDKGVGGTPPVDGAAPTLDGTIPPTNGMPLPMEQPQEVDDIQNEIIKHNIEAMKSIHGQLETLNNMTQSLNAKLEGLSSDVAEVREPTNSEKLMNKAKVSYPYYLNLNSFWSGNWFDEQRDKELSKGIQELPDGTFVADFDDLPQKSKIDIQNSFNDI